MKKNPPTVSGSAESNGGQARKERVVTRLELIKMPPETEAQLPAPSTEPNFKNLVKDLEDFQSGAKPLSDDLVNCLETQLRLLMAKKRNPNGSGPDFDPEPPPGGATALPVPKNSTPIQVRLSA